MLSVKIGPSFFANELQDYENWHWAMVREAAQNSIDAKGSSKITFDIVEYDHCTFFSWCNDGEPMTEDILVNKLFALGESGKRFEGTTGGFGKAKVLLYFTHSSYKIRTGHMLVEGSGADYEITESNYFHGTHSTVAIEGHHKNELLRQIDRFINAAQWKGTFVINGEEKEADLRKGSPRRDLGFGKVYTNKSFRNRMIVRINGVPMFIQRTSFDRCVIVELKGASNEVLTSNRDGLVYPFRNELSDFITELAVDKRSALKNKNRGPRYVEYRGTKLCHQQALDVVTLVEATLPDDQRVGPLGDSGVSNEETVLEGVVPGVDIGGDEEVHAPVMHESGTDYSGGRAAAFTGSGFVPRRQVASLGTNFILKNETDLKIPAYYDPGSGEFSSYSHKLVRIWGRIMLELHRLFDREAEFSIGFIFDEGSTGSTEAECEQGDFGLVYYLNPCEVVEQSSSYSKSFRKRFKLTERDRLIAVGAHEFVHALGYGWHDERYANKLTDVLATVMKHRKRFNWCFQ